jgi:hypothetical protein
MKSDKKKSRSLKFIMLMTVLFEPSPKAKVIHILGNLNSHSTPGHDRIHSLIIQNLPGIFVYSLVLIVNLSMNSSAVTEN